MCSLYNPVCKTCTIDKKLEIFEFANLFVISLKIYVNCFGDTVLYSADFWISKIANKSKPAHSNICTVQWIQYNVGGFIFLDIF